MSLSFEHTMPIDSNGSYIASLTFVNPSNLQANNLHTSIGGHIAAKTNPF